MDITEQSPAILSLCTGYGGIERGIARAIGQLNVLAHVEIEAYAIANLVDKMEQGEMAPAPIWTNLKTLPLEPFRGRVDILVGGYPCQPFSSAGQRKGTEDPRHLWPYIRRIIKTVKPTICFFENVEGHISLGLSTVLSDLEEDGYSATWGIFSASEVGAPHQRKRVFIMAHRTSEGLAQCSFGERVDSQRWQIETRQPAERSSTRWPARPGEEQYEWEEPRTY